ncbi:MAG: hypothetical protein FWG93_05950 [Oscillospiraceae bacterium]|nr:hypothetical protein [Oscillospiraceae bacterium]
MRKIVCADRCAMLVFGACAALLLAYVVFFPPLTGVADQNDFSRMMYGLAYKDSEHYFSVQRNVYVAEEYALRPFPYQRLLGLPPALSPIYFIYPARILSQAFGFAYFRLGILAALAGAAYVVLMTALYGLLLPKKLPGRLLLGALLLFVFFDGGWLMWFYSLYGEPYLLIGLSCMAVCFLLCMRRALPLPALIGLAAGCFMLAGAKMQAIVLYPVCAGMLICVWVSAFRRRGEIRRFGLKTLVAALALPALLLYCFSVYMIMTNGRARTNRVTLYHSVMYGLLMDADDPAAVLTELGLDPGLAADAGRHSYLPESEYVYAPPKSGTMQREFYDKIGNLTLVRYYLTHPAALWRGMEYLASQSLRSKSGLGKHTEAYPELVGRQEVRFSAWEGIRNALPKQLWFLLLVCAAAAALSVTEYLRGENRAARPLCILVWFMLAAGVLQFPMPYLFNGRADTAKQLFGFNYVFDIALVAVIGFGAAAVARLIRYSASRRTSSSRPVTQIPS